MPAHPTLIQASSLQNQAFKLQGVQTFVTNVSDDVEAIYENQWQLFPKIQV